MDVALYGAESWIALHNLNNQIFKNKLTAIRSTKKISSLNLSVWINFVLLTGNIIICNLYGNSCNTFLSPFITKPKTPVFSCSEFILLRLIMLM